MRWNCIRHYEGKKKIHIFNFKHNEIYLYSISAKHQILKSFLGINIIYFGANIFKGHFVLHIIVVYYAVVYIIVYNILRYIIAISK